jgi:hypothetical protein
MMETSHASFLPSLAACVGTYFLFTRFIATTQDPREPPLNSGTIPYVGHVNGLMRSKSDYYIQLRYLRLPLLQHQAMEIVTKSSRSHKSPQPIFTMTMTMPGQKVYVVTTPELFQAIQKQPKAFAFPPIAAKSSSKICGTSLEAHGILMKNATGDDGDWGLPTESYAAMRAALPSGAGFGDMNRMMIRDIAASLNSVKQSPGECTRLALAKWLRKSLTAVTTNSVYGLQNPFKDSAIADGFWCAEKIHYTEKHVNLIE